MIIEREIGESCLDNLIKDPIDAVVKEKLIPFDFLPDAVFAVDKAGKIIAWNNALAELTGIPATEMLGKANFQYALPIFGERRPMLLDVILEENELIRRYYPEVTKDTTALSVDPKPVKLNGKDVWIKCKASPLLDKDGRIIGAIQSIIEIPYQQYAIAKGDNYNLLFEQTRDIILLVLLDGRIIDANQTALDTYGYTKEEMQNLTIFQLRSSESRNIVISQMEAADKTGILFETIHERKDGSRFYVEINAKGIYYQNQRVLLSTIRDITERKKVELALQQSVKNLKSALEGTVHAFGVTIEKRDPFIAGHQQKVANISTVIASEMGLSGEIIESLKIAGLLHDIGKINLPAEILNKPAKLSLLEVEMIKTHVESGYEIVKSIPFKQDIASIILQHHERLDGSGYPRGLKQEDILLEAKILAVADVVEAMASQRAYRASLGLHQAITELIKNKDILYDPYIVETCLKLYQKQILQQLIDLKE